ncbi:MAG: PucR-like helix-turn-helix protein [Solirubrobacterales bacterium]|nr:PucR-like helix-turn-helix protein [Solirubrobacterales bacterium]
MASVRGAVSQSANVWQSFLEAVRAENNVSVERTVESLQTMPSYSGLGREALELGVRANFDVVLAGIGKRRRPDRSDDPEVFLDRGRTRGRQGVAVTEMLTAWRVALEALYETARRVAPDVPEREGLLLEFLELALTWTDFGMVAAAQGHREAELARAREQQQTQTNLVRRLLTGIAAPAEIRTAIVPLGLEPEALYHAVIARPDPSVDLEEIERFLRADGLVSRGNGLVALIDGDACGFIKTLPDSMAPSAFGISEPALLSAMEPAFRSARRALDTALAIGSKGVFELSDFGVRPAVAEDADVGTAMVERYVSPVLALSGGEAVLTTVESYLANDCNAETTAAGLEVHPNTVRHRLGRFEEATGRSLRATETLVEIWWALERRQFS